MELKKNNFSELEQEVLSNLIESKTFKFTDYSEEKSQKRDIDVKKIYKVIKKGEIVEYHFIDDKNRVLLKGRPNNKKKALCVLVDLDDDIIVTTFYNPINKNVFYESEANILTFLEGIVKDIVINQEKNVKKM